MDQPEIKLCPFCGGTPEMHQSQDETSSAGHALAWFTSVSCPDCDVRHEAEASNREQSAIDAIAKWNQRSSGEIPADTPPLKQRCDDWMTWALEVGNLVGCLASVEPTNNGHILNVIRRAVSPTDTPAT